MRIGSVGVGRAIVGAGAEAGAGVPAARAPEATPRASFAECLRPTRARVPAPVSAASPSGSFDERVAAVAARVGMRKDDLMAIMRFESGLRPDALNPTTHAVGLIQFLPRTAAELLSLPLTRDGEARAVQTLAAMSADEQLDYVAAYLDRALGGRGAATLRDAYMAVLYPEAVGRGDAFVLGRADGGEGAGSANGASAFSRAVYRANAALDANRDGVITAGEAARRVAGTG
jgi:hypothetical protein